MEARLSVLEVQPYFPAASVWVAACKKRCSPKPWVHAHTQSSHASGQGSRLLMIFLLSDDYISVFMHKHRRTQQHVTSISLPVTLLIMSAVAGLSVASG